MMISDLGSNRPPRLACLKLLQELESHDSSRVDLKVTRFVIKLK